MCVIVVCRCELQHANSQVFSYKNTFIHRTQTAATVISQWLIERRSGLFVISFQCYWSKTNPPLYLTDNRGCECRADLLTLGERSPWEPCIMSFFLRGYSERKCEMNSQTGSQFQLPWMKAFNPRWIPLIYSSSGRQPELWHKRESTKCFCTLIQAVLCWASQRHCDSTPKQVSI